MSVLSLSFIVNLAAVIAGGILGSLFRGRLRIGAQQLTVRGTGIVILAVSAFGIIYSFFPFNSEGAEIVGWILIIIAMLVGRVFGRRGDIEGMLDKTAAILLDFAHPASEGKKNPGNTRSAEQGEKKSHSLDNLINKPVYNLPSARSGHRFADGFAIASLYLITTSLTLHGLVTAGLVEPSLLYWKALLDFAVMAALASVYGTGVPAAALTFVMTVAVIDLAGGLWNAMHTGLVGKYDTLTDTYSGNSKALNLIKKLPGEFEDLFVDSGDKLVRQLAVIGAVITTVLGLNMGADRQWKAANLLPAVLIPIVYYGMIILVKIIEAASLAGDAAALAGVLSLF